MENFTETATTLDAEIATLPPSLVNDILLNAKQFYIGRVNHRHLHITEIEQPLAG